MVNPRRTCHPVTMMYASNLFLIFPFDLVQNTYRRILDMQWFPFLVSYEMNECATWIYSYMIGWTIRHAVVMNWGLKWFTRVLKIDKLNGAWQESWGSLKTSGLYRTIPKVYIYEWPRLSRRRPKILGEWAAKYEGTAIIEWGNLRGSKATTKPQNQ